MSFTISIRSVVETAETLARRVLTNLYSAWSVSSMANEIVSVPYNTTTSLIPATTYVLQADPLATIVVGWTYDSVTVELPLNQLTVIAPPATPYLRNTSTASTSNPVPVRVVAFS